MKKLVTLLLASAMALSLFGCNKETSDQSTSSDSGKDADGKVSVWLPVSKTYYGAEDNANTSKTTYTYSDKGLPLSVSVDNGPHDELWNDDLGIYEFVYYEIDGNIDNKTEYFYNDQGDYLYYSTTINTYNGKGELIDSNTEEYGKDLCEYHYDSNGKIESVDWHTQSTDGTVHEAVSAVYHYCYDDNGNLVEIYNEHLVMDKTWWCNDFRYDEDGRLTASTYRFRDACTYYQYQYDSDGRLTDVTQFRSYWQLPLDNQHISQSSDVKTSYEFSMEAEAHFSYDDNGNLISRQLHEINGEEIYNVECTYDKSGKLSTVTYEDEKYVYVDNEKDADSSATTLVQDKHGNIVKVIFSDGDYVAYEYKQFRLTEEEATKCKNIQVAMRLVDPLGRRTTSGYFEFAEGDGFVGYMPLVHTPLYQTDVLRNKYSSSW